MSVRILLVGDNERCCASFVLIVVTILLAGVWEGKNGLEAAENARSLRPDSVFMDISVPRMNGIGANPNPSPGSPESERQNDATIVSG